MKLFECSAKIYVIHSSIRSALAQILLEKGYSSYKISKLLGVSSASITHYRKGKRGGLIKQKLLEDDFYRKWLTEISEMIIQDDGRNQLSPLIEEEICKLCRTIRKKNLFEDNAS